MTKVLFALALLLTGTAAGCATGKAVPAAPLPSASPSHSGGPKRLVGDGYTGHFRVAATVLENSHHGPQLCVGVMDSLPPQCGGPDVSGWTWNGLQHESAMGTTWGSYILTGTFDGRTFALTEPARANDGSATPSRPTPDFTSPCPQPAGGWRPIDPAKASDSALQAANVMVNDDTDFGGLWIDQKVTSGGQTPVNDPTMLVLNVRFTKDLARHEADIRKVWGGALCVSQARHSFAELTAIQNRITEGPGLVYTSIDVVAGTVEMEVFVATQTRQRELDSRYGPGVVELIGAFEPID